MCLNPKNRKKCKNRSKLKFSPNLHLVSFTKSGYIGIKYIMPSWVKTGGYKVTTTQHPPQPPSYPYPSNPHQYHSSYYGYNHNLYHHGFNHNGYHQVGYKYDYNQHSGGYKREHRKQDIK